MSIFGDGTNPVKCFQGRRVLNDYDKLAQIGTEAALPADVKSSFHVLHDKIAT